MNIEVDRIHQTKVGHVSNVTKLFLHKHMPGKIKYTASVTWVPLVLHVTNKFLPHPARRRRATFPFLLPNVLFHS
jgi:hypothetical protein